MVSQGGVFTKTLLIIAVGAWIFWPALHGGWLWDDDTDITGNAITKSATGLWSIWFQPGTQLDYYPVKASVQWVQWHLWGKDTLGYHLTNVILHIASALLAWRLFDKLGLRLAWLGGLLFLIHPTAVESVAWIAELKNTLSLPPFLLAMLFYLDFDEHHRVRDYVFALGFFLFAMLCKTTMVMFPVVILLHAWWKRGRIGWGDLKASAPFFVISLALGLVTLFVGVWYQQLHQTVAQVVPLGGFFSRLALAGLALSFYFWNAIWPVGLMPIYPQWIVDPPSLLQFLPGPILAGILYWFWTQRATWGRHALFGLGFFLVMLLPFVTLNVGGYTQFTWVMDHFLYIPILGVIGLAITGLDQFDQRLPVSFRPGGRAIVMVVLATLAWGSHAYAKKYANQKSLLSYTVAHNPGAWIAHNDLGEALFEEGRRAEAIDQFEQALSLKPNYAEARNNYGATLLAMNRPGEAIQQAALALEIKPDYAEAHNNWGIALVDLGRPDEAIPHYQEAVRINPEFAEARANWGAALVKIGRVGDSLEHFQEAVRLKPDYAEAYYNWGIALIQAGQAPAAIDKFQEALRLKPDYTEARNNWGVALAQLGRKSEAMEQFQEALRLDPDNASAKSNLAAVAAGEHHPSGK